MTDDIDYSIAGEGQNHCHWQQCKQPCRLRSGNRKGWREDWWYREHADIQDPILPVAKMQVMRMIYGGQMDAFDHHRVGFDFSILRGFLLAAGFSSVQRVDQIDEVL